MLTSVDFSSSGECLAFGGSGGYVHVWGYSQEPRVNLRSSPLEMPPLKPQPTTRLEEDQPFSIAAVPYYTEVCDSLFPCMIAQEPSVKRRAGVLSNAGSLMLKFLLIERLGASLLIPLSL